MDIQKKIDEWVIRKQQDLQETTNFIAGYGNLKPVEKFEWDELKAVKWAITLNESGNRERLMSFENSVFLRAGWSLEVWVKEQNRYEEYRMFWMGMIPEVKLFVSSWFENRVAELNTKHEFLSRMIARWGEVKCENDEVRALLSAESNGDEMLHFENLYLNTTPFPIQKYQKFFKGYPDENPSSTQQGNIVESSQGSSRINRDGEEAEILVEQPEGIVIHQSNSQQTITEKQSEESNRTDREGEGATILAYQSEDIGRVSIENAEADFKKVEVENGEAEIEEAIKGIQLSRLDTEQLNLDSTQSESETVANKPDKANKAEKNRRKREAQKMKKQALKEAKEQELNLMDEALKVGIPAQIPVQDEVLLTDVVANFEKGNEGTKLEEIHRKATQFVQGRIRKLGLKEKKSVAFEFFTSLLNVKLDKEDVYILAAVANELGLPKYPELQNQLVAHFKEKREKAAALEQSIADGDAKLDASTKELNELNARLEIANEKHRVAKKNLKEQMLKDYAEFKNVPGTPNDEFFFVESVKFCQNRYSFLTDVLSKSKSEVSEIDSELATKLLDMYKKVLSSDISIEQAKLMVFTSYKVKKDRYAAEAMLMEHILGVPETDH